MTQLIFGAVQLGLIYALMAMGNYISFRILNIPDLTVDGSFALGMAVPEFGALFSFGKLGAAGFAAVAVMTLLTFTLHELYKLAASHSPSDRGRKKKGPAEKPKKAPTVKKGSIFGLDDTDDDDTPEPDDAGDTSNDISDENDINENETESENDD